MWLPVYNSLTRLCIYIKIVVVGTHIYIRWQICTYYPLAVYTGLIFPLTHITMVFTMSLTYQNALLPAQDVVLACCGWGGVEDQFMGATVTGHKGSRDTICTFTFEHELDMSDMHQFDIKGHTPVQTEGASPDDDTLQGYCEYRDAVEAAFSAGLVPNTDTLVEEKACKRRRVPETKVTPTDGCGNATTTDPEVCASTEKQLLWDAVLTAFSAGLAAGECDVTAMRDRLKIVTNNHTAHMLKLRTKQVGVYKTLLQVLEDLAHARDLTSKERGRYESKVRDAQEREDSMLAQNRPPLQYLMAKTKTEFAKENLQRFNTEGRVGQLADCLDKLKAGIARIDAEVDALDDAIQKDIADLRARLDEAMRAEGVGQKI